MIKVQEPKRDKPRKGGDGKRSGQEKAPVPPPAGMGKAGRPKGDVLTPLLIKLAPALVTRIEDWRHGQKISTRLEAIRVLLERGLKP